jgi:hypothetical protein
MRSQTTITWFSVYHVIRDTKRTCILDLNFYRHLRKDSAMSWPAHHGRGARGEWKALQPPKCKRGGKKKGSAGGGRVRKRGKVKLRPRYDKEGEEREMHDRFSDAR